MQPPLRPLVRRLFLAGLLLAISLPHTHAEQNRAVPLADNAGMDTDSNHDDWPDGWGLPPPGGTWENEADNRFLRLTNSQPGALVTMPRDEIKLPETASAIDLSWRQRISGLVPGPQNGDIRVVLEFLDAGQARLPVASPPTFYRTDTTGWETRSLSIAVPPGARTLRITPALVRIAAGTLDLDDLHVTTSLDQRQNSPDELKVSGNRLVSAKTGKEIWLQGINVSSLEWSLAGEKIDRSIQTAIGDWKANVIRLPVREDFWFGRDKGQSDGGAAYRKIVDDAVRRCADNGVYLVLDLHRYRAARAEHVEFWQDAAARYANHPAVLFDLLNEPHGTDWEIWQKGGFVEDKNKKGDEDAFLSEAEKRENKRGFDAVGMQALLDTVRSVGARNIVVVGGLDYAYRLDGVLKGNALSERGGNGIMYSTHLYPWKKSWQKAFLDAAKRHPILVGEVGGDAKKMTWMPAKYQEDVDTWAPAVLGVIQKHKLNWTAWCFHPKASPRMLLDWNYTPTPFWGQLVKDALSGKQFDYPEKLR